MSPALTRPRTARWCPPAVAVAAAVLATLLVLMFSGHHTSAWGSHHAHLTQNDHTGNCVALVICTVFLTTAILATGAAFRRSIIGRPVHLSWAMSPLPVLFRDLAPSPDLIALGISRT